MIRTSWRMLIIECVEIVRGVVQEVSADLEAMENAYVAAVMKALGRMAGLWCQGSTGHAHCQCQRVGRTCMLSSSRQP